MKLICFGLNHRTAPVHVRERWALSADESKKALTNLRGSVSPSEHLILCTCNRTELYSHIPYAYSPAKSHSGGSSAVSRSEGTELVEAYAQFYAEHFCGVLNGRLGGAPFLDDSFDPAHYYVYVQEHALEHLFRLISGLDSMILGESQIMKQVKEAYGVARDASAVGKFFHRLFPAALRVGKKVRSLTSISQGCITPGQAALKLSQLALGGLEGKSLLVIGSGKIATSAALAFLGAGVSRHRVVNRTAARAEDLVARMGVGEALPWSDLPQALSEADVIVSSTGSVEPIVTKELLTRARAARNKAPLAIVDLAIPRDFDADVSEIPGVFVFNIDDLNQVIQENVADRHAHLPLAEEIILQEMQIFQRQMTYLKIDPVLRHMSERFDQIRLGELQSYIGQFPPELHPVLAELTSSLVKKLLHFPIEKLKSLRDLRGLSDAEASFLKHLFMPDV